MSRRLLLVIVVVVGAFPLTAAAHEVRPAYLELCEVAPETYETLWKVPARGGERRLGISVRLPDNTEHLSEPHAVVVGGASIERWRIRSRGGLAGQTIRIEGLAATGTDVLIRVKALDGSNWTALARPSRPWVEITPARGGWAVAGAYLLLGVEHILGGVDHLMFLLALLLIVRRRWRVLLATITAFTLAHSMTLTLAALRVVHVPQAPVEAIIALSIVFVASEIVHERAGRRGLTARAPWVVAFTFGLLHGFGFAGALSEVGLPEQSIPLALLFFNLGVEVGQLLFVATATAIVAVSARLCSTRPKWAEVIPPYALGSCASFWVIQRLAAF